jgi:hypothetical protein
MYAPLSANPSVAVETKTSSIEGRLSSKPQNPVKSIPGRRSSIEAAFMQLFVLTSAYSPDIQMELV